MLINLIRILTILLLANSLPTASMAEVKLEAPSFWYFCHLGHECHLDLSDESIESPDFQEPKTKALACEGEEQQPLFNFVIREKKFYLLTIEEYKLRFIQLDTEWKLEEVILRLTNEIKKMSRESILVLNRESLSLKVSELSRNPLKGFLEFQCNFEVPTVMLNRFRKRVEGAIRKNKI
jgi:hypothetical protein